MKCITVFILAILPSVGSIAVLVLVNVVSAIRDVLARRQNFFTFYAYFVTFKYFGFVYLPLVTALYRSVPYKRPKLANANNINSSIENDQKTAHFEETSTVQDSSNTQHSSSHTNGKRVTSK